MMNFYKNLCGRKGFTLIELVAVTAMLGALPPKTFDHIESPFTAFPHGERTG